MAAKKLLMPPTLFVTFCAALGSDAKNVSGAVFRRAVHRNKDEKTGNYG
jgi:hypothetical protein